MPEILKRSRIIWSEENWLKVFSRPLQCSAIVIIRRLSSVTRMYCGQTTELRSRRFHWKVAQCLKFSHDKSDDEIGMDPSSVQAGGGLKLGWVVFFDFTALYSGKDERYSLDDNH